MPTDSMVERVAKGIRGAATWSSFWSEDDALILARAAIAAMRAPSGEMQAIGRDVIQPYLVGGRVAKPVGDQWQIGREVYMAMIDAALDDAPKSNPCDT